MEYKYKAFISYNHNPRDTKVAETLHRMIETYSIPRKLRDGGVKKPGKVFRDEEELSASSDLSGHIREALDGSEFLIVICSPGAVASKWVSQEISHFLENHAPERILTVLTGGNGGELYEKLLPGLPEPLFLDLTESSDARLHRDLKERFLKLCAPLLGREYDELVMRDQKRRRQRLLSVSAAILTVAAVIIGILLWSNHRIEGKNEELEAQNNEILLRESELLTNDALEALENKDQVSAVRNALAALPSAEQDRPYYAPAESALFSSLDLLNIEEGTVVPQNTVLEQASPIEDFCISADGSLLITVDPYSVVTCFDTVTGEQVWIRQIEESSHYNTVKLCVCDAWDSVILMCNDTFVSLSQQTGDVLWSNQYAYFEERFELSDDGRYLASLVDRGYQGSLFLTVISTETGDTLNTYPVSRSDVKCKLLGNIFILTEDYYDFSSDGQKFAGCYREEREDQSNELVYFVTDLLTGQTEEVYRWMPDDSHLSVITCAFSDQDRTLTVVYRSSVSHRMATVDKVSIRDHELLWHTEVIVEPADYLSTPLYGLSEYHWLFHDSYILIGTYNMLSALDAQTGEVLNFRELDSNLIHLEQVQGDYFALVFEDGTYNVSWINREGLYFWDFGKYPLLTLRAVQNVRLWKDGYLKIIRENGISLNIGTVEQGFGYIASIPADNGRSVVIQQAVPFEVNLDRQMLFATGQNEELEYNMLGLCGEKTLALETVTDEYKETEYHSYTLFDRETLEKIGSFDLDGDLYEYGAFLVNNGAEVLYESEDYDFKRYNTVTQQSETILQTWGDIQLRFGDRPVNTRVQQTKNIRLSQDYSILSVFATNHGFGLWRDGEKIRDVPYPDGLILKQTYWLDSDSLILGANGWVLLDMLVDTEKPVANTYLLYDMEKNKWHRIPFGKYDAVQHVVCLGESSPLFTIMDSRGLLRVYDIPSGAQVMEVATGLTSNAVAQMQWIMDDRYLTIYTEDEQLLIFDGTTGENVYRMETQSYFWNPPRFAADRLGKRLYIWRNAGLCVDIDSWTLLTEIPGMVFYDSVSDCIFLSNSTYEDEISTEFITTLRLPTTEEIIELGKQFLGQ